MASDTRVLQFSFEEAERSIPERFARVVATCPDAVAISAGDERLTYAEFARRVDALAQAIAGNTAGDDAAVAVAVSDRVATITAMLATWKAGGLCVPLDATLPEARLEATLRQSEARLVVTDRATGARLARNSQRPTLDIGETGAVATVATARTVSGGAPACVLYSSGSTGEPKGVVRTHRSILHRARQSIASLGVGTGDRISALHPPSTAGGSRDMAVALLGGAALVAFDLKRSGFGELCRWIAEERISILCTVASTLRQLLASADPGTRFEALRVVRLGSEPLYRHDVERLRRHLPPECILVTSYGATEANGITEYRIDHSTPLANGRIPAGFPLDGVEITLRDADGRPVRAGEAGEVVVRSRYLSSGYWRSPQATREAFEFAGGRVCALRTGDLGRLRPDGCLELLGRRDDQVKVRGYRVNPGEIEGKLTEHPAIREAVVTASAAADGETRLVAYVVAQSSLAPTRTLLRRHLEASLPPYMIPSSFVVIDELPLTASGKVDRRALPAASRSAAARDRPYVAPRTPTEAKIAAMWEKLFGVARIGVDDNFLDLGGDSLLAATLVSMIEQAFGRVLSSATPLRAPTVADLARAISESQGTYAMRP